MHCSSMQPYLRSLIDNIKSTKVIDSMMSKTWKVLREAAKEQFGREEVSWSEEIPRGGHCAEGRGVREGERHVEDSGRVTATTHV